MHTCLSTRHGGPPKNALTNYVEHEADEPVMRCEWKQHLVNKHDVLEVVDDALSIKEVHSCPEKVPVQRLGKA
jgi:hypothetical protein